MSLNRRHFLQHAAFGLTAAASLGKTEWLEAAQAPISKSPNEKISIAYIGVHGRGKSHIDGFTGRSDIEVLYVCDADEEVGQTACEGIAKKYNVKPPQYVKDMRKLFDDPKLNAITTATPNHWHSLTAIWAMQAGKDVYVEKPVSHNVWEGRQAVNAARKYNKMCQAGTQSRSSASLAEAVKYVQEGNLGAIQYAIGTCYKPRQSIGKLDKPLVIPKEIDYDLWCGPAAKVDLYRPKLHYDWHWDYNTGNGDLGNQGIHQMDIARWFLGEKELSPDIISFGGRFAYEDAGNTPNTQIILHNYKKAPLIFEVRGLPKAKEFQEKGWGSNMDNYRGSQIGVIVQCEKGYVVIPSYTQATAYSPDNKEIKTWKVKGEEGHFENFVKGMRTRKHEDLNADILQGHLSSALCHTGNVSYQLGKKASAHEIAESVKGNELLADSFNRMVEHLAANGVPVDQPIMTRGEHLSMDGKAEKFLGNDKASQMLSREYRKPYVVPEITV
jgi:predicted dehydrogenase